MYRDEVYNDAKEEDAAKPSMFETMNMHGLASKISSFRTVKWEITDVSC